MEEEKKLTIYGFINDGSATQYDKLTSNVSPAAFFLAGEEANYIVNKTILGDPRDHRLNMQFVSSENNEIPSGRMNVVFDGDRVDLILLNGLLEDTAQDNVFNIIEAIYLSEDRTLDVIDEMLSSDNIYNGYVDGSVLRSTAMIQVPFETDVLELNDFNNGDYRTTTNINVPTWISFQFTSKEFTITFKLWIDRATFATEYPFTTILGVIPPYDPTALVSTNTLVAEGNLSVLQNGSAYIFNDVNRELLKRDQNGLYTFNTKFVVSKDISISIPFSIVYSGPRVPTSLECRIAIREYLEANTNVNSEVLNGLFPDLYINSRFTLVPLWDVKQDFTDRVVYNSVNNYFLVGTKADLIFSDVDPNFMASHLEVLTNSQNKMLLLSLPDSLNADIFSILDDHPTYQDYSSTNTGFKFMELKTQDFATKLSRAMAVLQGETLSSDFLEVEIDGLKYISFTAGISEYLVMSEESYYKKLEERG